MRSRRFSIGRLGNRRVDQYNFNWGGSIDAVSRENLPDANYEGAHQRLNLTTAILESFTTAQCVRGDNGVDIFTRGAWKEQNLYPLTPDSAGWVLVNATRSANTAENVGDLTPQNIISAGDTADNVQCWRSISAPASGAPTGIQFIQTLYKPGTSGKIYIPFTDITAGTVSSVGGTAGATEVLSQAAGALSIVSDVAVGAGFRILSLKMNFTNKGNSLSAGVGPYSATAGQTVIIYGMSVAGAVGTGDIVNEVPITNGNPGNVATWSSLSGTTERGPRFTYASAPKLLDALDGVADGTVVLEDHFNTDTTANYTVSSSEGSLSYVDSSYMRCTFSTTNAQKGIYRNSVVTIGKRYEVSFKAKGTRASIFGSIIEALSVGLAIKNPVLSTTFQDYLFRVTATQVALRLYLLNAGSINDTLDIDDLVIREISPATGQIEWTGKLKGLPSASSGIVSGNASNPLISLETNGSIKVNDGTNTVSLADAPLNERITVRAPYDTDEMNVHVEEDSGTTATFRGTFGPGTTFGIGTGAGCIETESVKITKIPRSAI